jgi:hypothetical protein
MVLTLIKSRKVKGRVLVEKTLTHFGIDNFMQEPFMHCKVPTARGYFSVFQRLSRSTHWLLSRQRHFRCGPAVDTGKHDRQRALNASALTTFLNEQRWLPGDRVQSPPPTPISILTSTYTTPHLKSKINVKQQIKTSNLVQLFP